MTTLPIYQSPIRINSDDTFNLEQVLCLQGQNKKAIFDPITKNFNVQNTVLLNIRNKTYQLEQYHFHVPGEHIIDGKKYAGEIHYLFVEINSGIGIQPDENLLVIGRVIKDCPEKEIDLEKYPVKIPSQVLGYDGSLTTEGSTMKDFTTPVRWAMGKHPISLSISQIEPFAKDSREIQPLNGRLITKSCNHL